jgi:DNA-binding response OmpR family regulator
VILLRCAEEPAISTSFASPCGPRPLVVVAEDSADTLTMLGSMLKLRGFNVVLAGDGREALDAVLVHGPDAIVSDVNMPHLDGLGLCRAVRALRAGASLPVILWSSTGADDPRVLEAIALGGVEFVSKSSSITEIDARLWHVLTRGVPTYERSAAGEVADGDSAGAEALPVASAA